MRVVLTLLVRDEADVIEATLLHHYALGVDHVVATDHRSADGTSEVLRRFEQEGRLTLIAEESPSSASPTGSRAWRVSRRASSAPTG